MLSSFLDKFNFSRRENEIMLEAIKWHEEIYQGQDGEIKFYHSIVRNCDAFANVFTTANGAQQMTVENNGVTKKILDDFCDFKPLYIYSPQTKLDRALMLTACTYYVEFDFLRQEIIDKNYIDCIFETFSQYLNDEDKEIYKKAVEVLKSKYINRIR